MGANELSQALQRAKNVLARRPEAGLHDDTMATARWTGGTRVVSSHANGMQFQTDMPAELGGTGDQVAPGWFFRAGLASCAATSIIMAAASRDIQLSRLEVRASSRSDTRGLLGMQESDGKMVYAGPGELRLQVQIAAEGVGDDALRTLVDECLGHSPVPCAVRQETPVHIEVHTRLMDALSETLRVVNLVGAIFINARFTAPWCYQSPRADLAAPILEPGAERVVIFHMITEGECYVELGREAPVHLVAGDAIIFPQGDAHRMCSEPGLPPASGAKLDAVLARRPRQLAYGGGGATTRLVCGYLACDAQLARLLLDGLPPIVRVNVRGSNAGAWLESSVRYALGEARSPRPGGAGVLAKLAEVLFIEVLRLYMNEQVPERRGWLAGVGDRIVGAALHAMHRQPAHAWTLEELAQTAASSRSVLAERFQQLVGSSPIQYLTRWRMLLAANLLRNSNAPLSSIAQDVGYQTDTAFSRAFRREYGAPPAAWRRSRGTAQLAASGGRPQ